MAIMSGTHRSPLPKPTARPRPLSSAADNAPVQIQITLPLYLVRAWYEHISTTQFSQDRILAWMFTRHLTLQGLNPENFRVRSRAVSNARIAGLVGGREQVTDLELVGVLRSFRICPIPIWVRLTPEQQGRVPVYKRPRGRVAGDGALRLVQEAMEGMTEGGA